MVKRPSSRRASSFYRRPRLGLAIFWRNISPSLAADTMIRSTHFPNSWDGNQIVKRRHASLSIGVMTILLDFIRRQWRKSSGDWDDSLRKPRGWNSRGLRLVSSPSRRPRTVKKLPPLAARSRPLPGARAVEVWFGATPGRYSSLATSSDRSGGVSSTPEGSVKIDAAGLWFASLAS
jgi:hypothetical protein